MQLTLGNSKHTGTSSKGPQPQKYKRYLPVCPNDDNHCQIKLEFAYCNRDLHVPKLSQAESHTPWGQEHF